MTNKSDITSQAINIKISTRILLNRNRNESFSLSDFYEERQSGRMKKQNSFRTKLVITDDNLILLRGSWWSNGLMQSKLNYNEIIKFSLCSNKPQHIMLLITNENGEKEFLIIKSKAAAYLAHVLENHINNSRQRKRQAPQPHIHNLHEVKACDVCSVHLNGSNSNFDTPIIPARRKNSRVQSKPLSNIINDERTVNIKPREPRLKITRLNLQTNGNESINDGFIESVNNGVYRQLRSTPKPVRVRCVSESECTSSVTYYNEKHDRRTPNSLQAKSSRSRRSETQELKGLDPQKMSATHFDENSTPWEVNISYIKHDPMVGCVEDESGPIYMYSAHQLVPRLAQGYTSCESVASNDESSDDDDDDDENSSFARGSESSTYGDDENELEKFILSGRDHDSRTPNLRV